MLAKLRPRSAYDVMAALALFLVVTGGTAFAVVAANQVNSASIIDGQVKTPDLATDAVGPLKVKDNSLTGADVAESSLGTVPNADKLDGLQAFRFQHRIATPCPPATGIRLVTEGGAPECVRGPEARELKGEEGVNLCYNDCRVVDLALPAGTWAVSSKILVQTAGTHQFVVCVLVRATPSGLPAGVDEAYLDQDGRYGTLLLQGLVRVQRNGDKLTVRCGDGRSGSLSARQRITAIRLDNKAVYSNGQQLP